MSPVMLGVTDHLLGGVLVGERPGRQLLFITEQDLMDRYYQQTDSFSESTLMAVWKWCVDEALEWCAP